MKNRFLKRIALMACLLLCLGLLSGCTALDMLKEYKENGEIDVRALLGMSVDDEEDEAMFIVAEKGGSDVPYPDGFDTTARFADVVVGDTMCVVFNSLGLAGRDTGYFSPAGSSITVTAAAKTESTRLLSYKAALWKKVDGGAAYVEGATIQFTCDGDLYKAKISGLDPKERYKLHLSYDNATYTLVGGMSIEGISNGESLATNEEEVVPS